MPSHERLTREQERRKERILTQPRPSRVRESSSAVVLKEGDLFLLVDGFGDVPKGTEHGLGLFYKDCRFLDEYELCVDGLDAVLLSFSSAHGFEARHYLSNPDLEGARKESVSIVRERLVRGDALYEVLHVRSYVATEVKFRLEISYGSRFDDIFQIKGFARRTGRAAEPRTIGRGAVRLAARSADGATRTTTIAFSPDPDALDGRAARYEVRLPPEGARAIAIAITPRVDRDGGREDAAPSAFAPAQLAGWRQSAEHDGSAGWASMRSSDALLDAIVDRGMRDLRLLRAERRGDHFIAAGVPWFATLFGRDSATVGIQTLAFGPRIARETIEILASLQATAMDRYRDAEPGKILHELRVGPLAGAGLIPQSPAYYGTVDATLLFVILLCEHLEWIGDLDFVRSLLPNLHAAVEWSWRYADHDGDGFLDYVGRYAQGLINQGWKDSGNAIVRADGSLPEPPIALPEVQAYAYRAWQGAAKLLRCVGDDGGARDLERRMEELRTRFEERFWSDELGCYVLALENGGAACAVAASNAGQVLWGGIASAEHAGRVVERLMRADMWSGWGIRTLSSDAHAYNPIGYHLGSVWPHDNALIATGFRRYGHDREAARVVQALIEAAAGMRDYRLPELYAGFPRQNDDQGPVGYPVACSPQAWAAGAIPYALWNMLGLEAHAREQCLAIRRPALPESVAWLELRGVRVGRACVDLRFRREGDRVAWDADVREGDCAVEAAGQSGRAAAPTATATAATTEAANTPHSPSS